MDLSPQTTLILALIFAGSGALTWVCSHAVRILAIRFGVLAKRDERRRHDRATPLLGGAGFYFTLAALTLGAWLVPAEWGGSLIGSRFAICFLTAITLIFGIGFIDDVHELRAPPKFTAQILGAILVLLARPELPPLFDQFGLPPWLIALGLVLWIVGVTNAVNMIDGLDGLCVGVAGLSSLSLAAMMAGAGMGVHFPLWLALGLAGASAGFLFLNFNPAKMFLGDSGSLLLGFTLAVISVEVEVKRSLFVSLSMPIFLLGLPLMDVVLSMIRRQRKRRSLFSGDRSHLHHRLQQMGLSHRAVVLVLWSVSGYMNLFAYLLVKVPPAQSIYLYASVVPTLGFWLTGLYYIERRLSFQAAQFSQLILKRGGGIFAEKEQLKRFLKQQILHFDKSGESFLVVSLDTSEFLRQLNRDKPTRILQFYVGLYEILGGGLRTTDLVGRFSEHQFVAILPGAGGTPGSERAVLERLSERIKALQAQFNIYQHDLKHPEGFIGHAYPRDQREILKILDLTPEQLKADSPKRIA